MDRMSRLRDEEVIVPSPPQQGGRLPDIQKRRVVRVSTEDLQGEVNGMRRIIGNLEERMAALEDKLEHVVKVTNLLFKESGEELEILCKRVERYLELPPSPTPIYG